MNENKGPTVSYDYRVNEKPMIIQEPRYQSARKVRTLPRSLKVTAGLSYIDGLYVMVDGRAVRADGEFAERGQSTIVYRDGAEHWTESMSEAPGWVQDIVAEVREFERKRLA